MQYDIIIIGSGAGGGTLAYALASTGLKILILERGHYLPRELENWDPKENFVKGRYTTHEKWLNEKGKSFAPGEHYFVGGKTKVYGAALLRLREKDFEEVHHVDGISPPWPVKYKEFQSYYLEAEHLYHVHGNRHTDPMEPPEDHPYPNPALKHEPRYQEIYDDLHKKGVKAFHLPIGIRRNDEKPEKSQCVRCATCDGFPCLVDAKSDSHTTCINPALSHPNVTMMVGAKATRILTDNTGKKATAVEVEKNGTKIKVQGDLIVVSCSAVNTSALLLKSANDQHPKGLANSSGFVGRRYMFHNNSAIVALSRIPNHSKFTKTIGINDFYYGSDDWKYPLGHIQTLGKVEAAMLQAGTPFPTPNFPMKLMADHSVGWWITTEDLPNPDNRVTVDSKGNIQVHYKHNNLEAHNRLYAKMKEILHNLHKDKYACSNSIYLRKIVGVEGCAHQVGTCHFGEDPVSSVLDKNCKAHDLDNLYIVDGSFFPSSSSVNPGLTIIANALRVADHLCERLNVQRQKQQKLNINSFYILD